MNNVLIDTFQTEVPSNNGQLSVRTLNNNSESNNDLLTTYDVTINSVPEVIFTEGSCLGDLTQLSLIATKEELLIYLCEVLIRFDVDPSHYKKSDFEALIRLLIRSLLHLYESETGVDTFMAFAPLIGLGDLTTNPTTIALNNNHRFPGIYLVSEVGYYTHFDITVDESDLLNTVVLLVPVITDQVFVNYVKQVYPLTTEATISELTQLIYGTVTWIENLNFSVSNCLYYILGHVYNSLATTITLDDGDLTNPRIDVIYVDNTGTVGVIKGTPDVDPAKPLVNPASQLELTSIYINTAATVPSNITSVTIYDENIEWTFADNNSGSNVVYDLENTTDPYSNTYCLKVSTVVESVDKKIEGSFSFSDASISVLGGQLIFYIKTTGLQNSSIISINVEGLEGVNSVVITNNNSYGLLFSSTSWQRVVVPFADFGMTITSINTVTFKPTTYSIGSAILYFDKIGTQTGIVTTPTYSHPLYTPFNITTTGLTVIGSIKTDNIGSVTEITTRELSIPSYWQRTTTKLSPTTANDVVEFTTNASVPGIKVINSSSGQGLWGESANSVGVYGASNTSDGVLGSSLTGIGGRFNVNPSSTNSVVEVLRVERFSSGTPNTKMGGYIGFALKNNGTGITAGKFAIEWTNVTIGSESAAYSWELMESGSLALRMSLNAAGKLTVPSVNLSSGTALSYYGTDTDKNLVAMTTPAMPSEVHWKRTYNALDEVYLVELKTQGPVEIRSDEFYNALSVSTTHTGAVGVRVSSPYVGIQIVDAALYGIEIVNCNIGIEIQSLSYPIESYSTATTKVALGIYNARSNYYGVDQEINTLFGLVKSNGLSTAVGRFRYIMSDVTLNHEKVNMVIDTFYDGVIKETFKIHAIGDTDIIRGNYNYFSQSFTADTVGDWRQYCDGTAFYIQYCTVANASKGGGTWVTKQTITI